MKPAELKKMPIRRLRSHLLKKQFAIPKLQRNFVWEPQRAVKLLDSIYRHMPIGSLFLWEMDRKSAHLIRISTGILPAFSTTNKHIWFVIDGQQRLSVIHQAFEADIKENDAGRSIDFGRLCFVVNTDQEQENPPRFAYRKSMGNQFIPVQDILAPDWKSRMSSKAKYFLKKIQECRQRLLSYAVPVVTVRSATLEEIGEVFIRINSQGMKIKAADRAIALMGKIDVRLMAEELRQKVRDKFAIGSIDAILMGFNLVTQERVKQERLELDGDPPKLETMARQWSKRIESNDDQKRKFKKLWHKYQNAFLKAVDHLHIRFPVHDESYLPSANMLATLAVFFYHHAGPPNRHQATEIRKWFWATGVAQRYSGKGYHRNIIADAKFFESLACNARKRFVFRDRLDPLADIQTVEYASRSAKTRAFFCVLASQSPRLLETGDIIDFGTHVSHANQRDRHHIFPKAQLKNHFSSRVYNSLCNICYLVFSDHMKIGMKLPRTYLKPYREDGRQQFRRVMKSHLIPAGDDSGLWDQGIVRAFKKFRQQRLAVICSEFEKAAGIKLFRK